MIKSWQMFLESYSDEVSSICKKYGIKHWSINEDGLVDVREFAVDLTDNGLTKIPLKFGNVGGSFYCHDNKLTSLEGSPITINSNFNYNNNLLKSLKGCPKEVNGKFSCSNNILKTLKGCPEIVKGNFSCYNNNLISLEGLVSASAFNAFNNQIHKLDLLGSTMISKNISFLESVMLNFDQISSYEFGLIIETVEVQQILELNDFKLFNILRTHFPKKYAEVCALRDVDLSADLGELGF